MVQRRRNSTGPLRWPFGTLDIQLLEKRSQLKTGALTALRDLCALRRGQGLRPFPRAPLSPLAAFCLRFAPDGFHLTKLNTSCTIEMPASLRSDSVRVHPGMPFRFPLEYAFSFPGIARRISRFKPTKLPDSTATYAYSSRSQIWAGLIRRSARSTSLRSVNAAPSVATKILKGDSSNSLAWSPLPGLSGCFTSIEDDQTAHSSNRPSSGLYLTAARDNRSKTINPGRLWPARCKRRYREFGGGDGRDQAGLTAVAQETADEHNCFDLVLGQP